MSESISPRRKLQKLLRFIPTPGWIRHYPRLSRLEYCKKAYLCDTLLEQTGNMVFGGPFSTMRLERSLSIASDPRMILGSYEQEIHPVINAAILNSPPAIIDIGAAFGYYAVGFARKTRSPIFAFEAVEHPHWGELARLAQINEVSSQITQRGLCTPEELRSVCQNGSFILSDCEGAEEDLLDPDKVPALKTCTMLVELHEFIRPYVLRNLVPRFRSTHRLSLFEEQPRDPTTYRVLKHLPERWRPIAIEEGKWIPAGDGIANTWLRFMLLEPRGAGTAVA